MTFFSNKNAADEIAAANNAYAEENEQYLVSQRGSNYVVELVVDGEVEMAL